MFLTNVFDYGWAVGIAVKRGPFRHAVRAQGKHYARRVPIPLRRRMVSKLREWMLASRSPQFPARQRLRKSRR